MTAGESNLTLALMLNRAALSKQARLPAVIFSKSCKQINVTAFKPPR